MLFGFGERLKVGKTFQESSIVGKNGGDLRLLKHDLADPDCVRIMRGSPGKIPLMLSIPSEQLTAKDFEIELHTRCLRLRR